jgi:hypothetical protein
VRRARRRCRHLRVPGSSPITSLKYSILLLIAFLFLIGIFFARARNRMSLIPKMKNQCGEWDIILLQNHCNSLIINDLAERVGFELGLFPTVLHKKGIAENPCKHCYLSTPPSFTCFSNFTPFNYFFDFLELMRRSGRFRHAAEFSPSAFQRTGTIPGNFPHPLDTVSMARPVSRFVSQLVLFIPSTISFFGPSSPHQYRTLASSTLASHGVK